MNKSGKSAGDDRLPMEKINRSKVEGFTKYFKQRQGYFKDVFRRTFSEAAALLKIGENLNGSRSQNTME